MARARPLAFPLSAAGLALAAACLSGPDNQPPPVVVQPTSALADGGVPSAHIVAGYAWDPEAVQYGLGMCGSPSSSASSCSLQPTLTAGQVLFERTLVPQAQVRLLDLPGGRLAGAASATSGLYVIVDAPRAGDPADPSSWLYAATDGGSQPLGVTGVSPADGGTPADPAGLLPVPAGTTYFPTRLASAPIIADAPGCYGRPAPALSDVGILSAVARFKSTDAAPVTPADLRDPARYAGAIVWWVYGAGGQYLRRGLPGAAVSVQVGAPGVGYQLPEAEVIYVNWGCPTGPGLPGCPSGAAAVPGAAAASRSARNFYVPGASATSSNIGLAVVLLRAPPGAPVQPPPLVTLTVTDTVTASGSPPRPYSFKVYPPPVLRPLPGQFTFGETLADPSWTTLPLADYLCAAPAGTLP